MKKYFLCLIIYFGGYCLLHILQIILSIIYIILYIFNNIFSNYWTFNQVKMQVAQGLTLSNPSDTNL